MQVISFWTVSAKTFTIVCGKKRRFIGLQFLAKQLENKNEQSVCSDPLLPQSHCQSVSKAAANFPRPMCASTCEKGGLMKLLWLRLFMQKEQQCGQCRPPLKLRFPEFVCREDSDRKRKEVGGAERLILLLKTHQVKV